MDDVGLRTDLAQAAIILLSPRAITKVTFTKKRANPTIQEWFGSSGGGLPRRLGLKSLRRFFIWGRGNGPLKGSRRSEAAESRVDAAADTARPRSCPSQNRELPESVRRRSLQQAARGCGLLGAGGAVAADFQARDYDAEATVFFHLGFQVLENVADELRDFATAQAGHVDMVTV